METNVVQSGVIPVGVVCPYREKCLIADTCIHMGAEHRVEFSCAMLRAACFLVKQEDKRVEKRARDLSAMKNNM